MYTHTYSKKYYAPLSRNQHVRSISLVENFPLVAQSRRDCVIGDSPCDRAEEQQFSRQERRRKRRTRKRGNVISATCVSGDEMVKRSHAVAYFSRSCRGSQDGNLTIVYGGKRTLKNIVGNTI